MNRRHLVRRLTLIAFGMVMGKFDALKPVHARGQESQAALSVNLNQWRALVFEYRGKSITISSAEVFASLATHADNRP